ncbi:DUF885 domain-containing protein [Halioxenophilus sp. WMMB6]|uniref:DUF885 domain-containing protein n=1 Tax=Halioxenophilus sp. WMMB6 TaxID=3073815 RepID=UPI00295EA8C4|nr:DUF885 domain-containing protein [Halioxenophilus sp. WMMB6]
MQPLSKALYTITLFTCWLLIACSPKQEALSEMQSDASEVPAEAFSALLDRYYQEDLTRSPVYASYQGVKEGYGSWDEVSEAEEARELAVQTARQAELAAIDEATLPEQERMALAIARLNVRRKIEGYPYRNNDYVMQQFRAWHTSVPSILINVHKVSSKQDLRDYLSRLANTEPLFAQVRKKMAIQAELGVFPPRWSYPQMIEAAGNVISGYPFSDSPEPVNPIYADFQSKLTSLALEPAENEAFLQEAKTLLVNTVAPAYVGLIDDLKKYQAEAPEGDGVWRLPNGEAYYQYLLRLYTSTDLNAEEIHQLGLDNVERIHAEMRAIMARVGFEGSLQEFFLFMREEPQFYFDNSDAGREAYLQQAVAVIDTMRAQLDGWFGIQPQAELMVKRVEPFREKSAGKAFYQRPPPDGSRPGIYYVNLYKMASMPKYQIEALAYHEGIPGHHLQLAINAELKGISNYQKSVRFTAFTEGWGLYSEYLGKEMGFYQDPYSDFGRLAMELWRACRLVVDTGIHSQGWSREQAIQYLTDNTPNPIADQEKAIERYIVYPGQATAYLIGKIKILSLREQAQAALGEQFSMAQYHDLVLKNGPMPLSMLEARVNDWIASYQ